VLENVVPGSQTEFAPTLQQRWVPAQLVGLAVAVHVAGTHAPALQSGFVAPFAESPAHCVSVVHGAQLLFVHNWPLLQSDDVLQLPVVHMPPEHTVPVRPAPVQSAVVMQPTH
jgi:hypothetical protein